MSPLIDSLRQLDSAEAFLTYFDVPFEQNVVNVSRLHILQRFHQYLRQAGGLEGVEEEAGYLLCRRSLEQAYQDFVHSTPSREKVFKVFRDAEGVRTVSLGSLRASLASR